MASEESYRAIQRYLSNPLSPYDPNLSENERRGVRKSAGSYVLREGELFFQRKRRGHVGFDELEIVRDERKRVELITSFHEGEGLIPHHNRDVTGRLLTKRYWWRGVFKQVHQRVQACTACQKHGPEKVLLQQTSQKLQSGQSDRNVVKGAEECNSHGSRPRKSTTQLPLGAQGFVSGEDPGHAAALMKALDSQRLAKTFCDVTLLIQGQQLMAHKAVLSSISTYFMSLFTTLEENSEHNIMIDLHGFQLETFSPLLDFAYSGHLSVPLALLSDAVELGKHLGMSGIVTASENIHRQLEGISVSHMVEHEYGLMEERHVREKVEFGGNQSHGGEHNVSRDIVLDISALDKAKQLDQILVVASRNNKDETVEEMNVSVQNLTRDDRNEELVLGCDRNGAPDKSVLERNDFPMPIQATDIARIEGASERDNNRIMFLPTKAGDGNVAVSTGDNEVVEVKERDYNQIIAVSARDDEAMEASYNEITVVSAKDKIAANKRDNGIAAILTRGNDEKMMTSLQKDGRLPNSTNVDSLSSTFAGSSLSPIVNSSPHFVSESPTPVFLSLSRPSCCAPTPALYAEGMSDKKYNMLREGGNICLHVEEEMSENVKELTGLDTMNSSDKLSLLEEIEHVKMATKGNEESRGKGCLVVVNDKNEDEKRLLESEDLDKGKGRETDICNVLKMRGETERESRKHKADAGGDGTEKSGQREKNEGVNIHSIQRQMSAAQQAARRLVERGKRRGECNPARMVELGGTFDSDTVKNPPKLSGDVLCPLCKKSFRYTVSLRAHLARHSTTETQPARPSLFPCTVCGREFRKAYLLRKHLLQHTGVLPYSCPECRKPFSTAAKLRLHSMRHQQSHRCSCPVCKKELTSYSSLSSCNFIHTDKPRFKCSECGHLFLCSSSLSKHKLSHHQATAVPQACLQHDAVINDQKYPMQNPGGAKPFVCKICGKGYSWKKDLYSHLASHSITQPFRCLECGHEFFQKALFHRHLRNAKHKKRGRPPNPRILYCNICQKSFPYAREFIRHFNNHTGIKPFSCITCGLTWADSRSLKRHVRMHTGERPYICPMCDRSYLDARTLRTHLARAHGQAPASVHLQNDSLPFPNTGTQVNHDLHIEEGQGGTVTMSLQWTEPPCTQSSTDTAMGEDSSLLVVPVERPNTIVPLTEAGMIEVVNVVLAHSVRPSRNTKPEETKHEREQSSEYQTEEQT
uniref:Zinc finger and BTB domain containing 11 n=2 Tax=Eptatretus burgeri TaxID=7764 RepID=A0A8C4WXA5_EPTBU